MKSLLVGVSASTSRLISSIPSLRHDRSMSDMVIFICGEKFEFKTFFHIDLSFLSLLKFLRMKTSGYQRGLLLIVQQYVLSILDDQDAVVS